VKNTNKGEHFSNYSKFFPFESSTELTNHALYL
jgi:hypothetical protein